MKKKILFFTLLFSIANSLSAVNQSYFDSLKCNFSFNYYKDLSDTYGGGVMFSGEIDITRSWYGAAISYGHFQSQSVFILTIPVDEVNSMITIPFEEMAIMKLGTLSIKIIPIQNKWLITELLVGIAYAKANQSCYKNVDFSYNTTEKKFNYLLRDYQLIRKDHFGYQAGINLIGYPYKNIGLKLSARLQDLNHGGTFFLIGVGLCFKF